MTAIKKTGDVIKDTLHVEHISPEGKTFKIHFPSIVGDVPTSIGVNVTIDLEQLRDLQSRVNRILAWTCPKCGGALHNYRRSELDWDYKRCQYCGWDDR
jgi:hypothetical protein